jgi:hypothetical protein
LKRNELALSSFCCSRIDEEAAAFKSEFFKQLSIATESRQASIGFVNFWGYLLGIISAYRSIGVYEIVYQKDPDIKKAIYSHLYGFLFENKNQYMRFVDAMCYLLVINGQNLFNVRLGKYAETLDEIRKTSVIQKISFLNKNSFCFFKRKYCKVRNGGEIPSTDLMSEKELDAALKNLLLEITEIAVRTNNIFRILKEGVDEITRDSYKAIKQVSSNA